MYPSDNRTIHVPSLRFFLGVAYARASSTKMYWHLSPKFDFLGLFIYCLKYLHHHDLGERHIKFEAYMEVSVATHAISHDGPFRMPKRKLDPEAAKLFDAVIGGGQIV